jgi:hypothetical protein
MPGRARRGGRSDWRRRIPDLEWTVAETVAHIAEGLLWYATDPAADPRELSTMDLRVRPDTAPLALLPDQLPHDPIAASS